jgi:hypothetical protein
MRCAELELRRFADPAPALTITTNGGAPRGHPREFSLRESGSRDGHAALRSSSCSSLADSSSPKFGYRFLVAFTPWSPW